MGFLDDLGRLLRPTGGSSLESRDRARLLETWGMSDTSSPEFPEGRAPVADPDEMTQPPMTSDFDRVQWERKLRTILQGLPQHANQWDGLLADASALGFDPEWVRNRQRDEFLMLIRRVVADRQVTPEEHRAIELARSLIGLSDAEAREMVRDVVAEAEAIFGTEVQGKPDQADAPNPLR